ncbi:3-oxoacyl-ACP synthase III family protein [Kitasatospora azatica]|uniref:3-oxoacyl-ACP synthase III family protein n=1 Tax=Kitasatospora azatica TaxID=58347 RepID=UPI0007C6EB4F|nr:ketoacyl-ACP synthase III [Kitasatospora azatica]
MSSSIGIVGTGSYVPENIVSNEEIAAGAGVTADWIRSKTGINQRHRAADHEATSDLAAEAARRALRQAGLTADQVSFIVVATSTPDHPQPATASLVQNLIGAHRAAAFDLNAVCSGFLYALTVGTQMLKAGTDPEAPYGLVIGADIYSRILDYSDRKTAILFGDGAGAVVLGPVPAGLGVVETALIGRGDQHQLIGVSAGGSRNPATARTVAEGEHFFRMDGRGVRGFVQEALPAAVDGLLTRAGLPAEQVKHFVPHQANGVMLGEVWPELGLENARMHLTVDQHANTGAASVAITLDDIHRQGALRRGELVMLAGFGGGMNIGAALLRWALDVPSTEVEEAELLLEQSDDTLADWELLAGAASR